MKKIILLFLIAFAYQGQAQEEKVKPERLATKHEVGFSAGHATGVGISYRYYPKKWGIQVATTPIISSDETQFSIGTSLMYTLNQTRITKFYLYYGNHLYMEKYKYYDYNYDNNTETYQYSKSTSYNTGIGCGIELTAWQRVGFNFNFGLGFHYEVDDMYEKTSDWGTTVIGGGGIFYKL